MAGKILIVDDIPANLRLLSQILLDRGYEIRAAANGMRALASIETDPPDLLLLDIRMPGMDGFDVCQRIKQNPRFRDIPVIFISALDDIEDKMSAFSAGGVDYITKPFQIEEVIARVETHLSLRSLQQHLQEANRRMEQELQLAAVVQASMMRRHMPQIPGWQLAVNLTPAKMICGDFFDAFRLPDGRIAFLIADVVDKGVGAALYMSMSCALLRTYIMEHPANPEQVFKIVNDRILEDTATEEFVSVFTGILHPESGEIIYSNAGHNPPLLARAAQPNKVELLARTGTVLGILEDQVWQQEKIQLAAGDLLVLYTDGVPDAENEAREFFGMQRFTDCINAHRADTPEELQRALMDAVKSFTGSAEQFDDIALLILKRDAV